MKLSRHKVELLLLTCLTLLAPGCNVETPPVETGPFNHWYWSRLGWAAFVSVILGIGVAKLLCRLPIRAPLLDCIKEARSRFAWCVVLLALLVAPLYLWLDAWLSQPFGEDNVLAAWQVVSLVVLDWSTLAFMLVVALVFYFTVAVCTRYVFAPTCSCKFAFIPKARG